MAEKFTLGESVELARLLRKVKDSGYCWPDETTFNLKSEVVPGFANELIIMRNRGKEILLAVYEKPWKGSTGWWHLPGGYARMNDNSFETVGRRVSIRELGIDVLAPPKNAIGIYWWNFGEHDYQDARPFSVYVCAQPLEPVIETDNCRFFNMNDLPSPIIGGAHQNFFDYREEYLGVARYKGLL